MFDVFLCFRILRYERYLVVYVVMIWIKVIKGKKNYWIVNGFLFFYD